MVGDPIRVLIIGLNYAPERSGIAPYTAGLAERLAARGDRVRVLTTFPHYPQWRFADEGAVRTRTSDEHGVEVVRLRHRLPRPGSALSRVRSELSFGRRALTAGWGRPDVVVLVSPALFASALLSVRVRLQRARRTIVWIQDLYGPGVREAGISGRFGLSGGVVAQVEKRLIRAADGVAVIHERMVDEVVALGADRARTSVVRNWSHLLLVSRLSRGQMRTRLGWSPGETVVLHTGNMGAKQDLGNVIAAARVAAMRGSTIRFVLMGDGNMRSELERQAVGVPSLQIVDPLPASRYFDALRAADVLLVNEHPALRLTALPSKLTSYFASGRPVLAATAIDSLTAAEVALAGAGDRVEPADPDALVNAVEALVADPIRMRRLAANGRRYRGDRLTVDAAMNAFIVLVDQVLDSQGPRRGRSDRGGPVNLQAVKRADDAGGGSRAG